MSGSAFSTVWLAGFPSEGCLQAWLHWRFWALSVPAHPWKPHANSPDRPSGQDEPSASRSTAHTPTPAAPRQDGGPDPRASSSGRGCHGAAPSRPTLRLPPVCVYIGQQQPEPQRLGRRGRSRRPPALPPSIPAGRSSGRRGMKVMLAAVSGGFPSGVGYGWRGEGQGPGPRR